MYSVMTATSNTGDNRPGTFTKADPRINRKGRPKSFDALRSLAQEIANEKAKSGGSTLVIDGHAVTVAEAILRQWASSKDWQRQKGFIEIAYGKVPDKIEVSGDTIIRCVIDLGDTTDDPGIPSGAGGGVGE